MYIYNEYIIPLTRKKIREISSTEETRRYDESGTKSQDRNAFKRIVSTFLFLSSFFLSGSTVCHPPSPLRKTLMHAYCCRSNNPFVGVDWKTGEETSSIPRFNPRRPVRDIRESSLIVFKRDTLAHLAHGYTNKKRGMHARPEEERIFIGKQGGAAGGAQPCVFPIN